MYRWMLVGAVLAGCESEAPTELDGELGFAVQDAMLIPCRTATGEQMVFGLLRSRDGCSTETPRRRTCEGMTSLLSYPFACQTGAVPMTLTAADATLLWIGNVDNLSDLSSARVTAIERRTCGEPARVLSGDAVSLSSGKEKTTIELDLEELSGSVPVTLCHPATAQR